MQHNFLNRFQLNPLALIGAGIGVVDGISRIFGGQKQKNAATENPYQNNPYLKQQIGLAQQLYNARMAGATQAEQNIASTQSNTISNINRNATDSAQALALASGTQGTANDALTQLAMAEAQDKQAKAGMLNGAYGAGANAYNMDEQRRMELLGAGAKNQSGALQDLGSLGVMLGQLKMGAGKTLPTETGYKTMAIQPQYQVQSNMPKPNYFLPTNTYKSMWG